MYYDIYSRFPLIKNDKNQLKKYCSVILKCGLSQLLYFIIFSKSKNGIMIQVV